MTWEKTNYLYLDKRTANMTKDQFHIEMEDISMYPLERSADYYFWEEISFVELNENILSKLSD